MDTIAGKMTVFFDDPFWVGLVEVVADGELSVCKVTFGAEPKDCEIYDFVLKEYSHLRFSPAVAAAAEKKTVNPKRLQREIRKQLFNIGIGTKSQQALKLRQEQNKQEHRQRRREWRAAEKERLFELKQQKKKEKHRGR